MSRTRLAVVAFGLLAIIGLGLFFAPESTVAPEPRTSPFDESALEFDAHMAATEMAAPTEALERATIERKTSRTSDVADTSSAEGVQETDAHVITTAYVEAQVNSVDIVATRIEGVVQRHGGQVLSRNFNKDESGAKSGHIAVKVPSEKFSEAYQELKGLVTFLVSESTSAVDVTEEYIDLTARLENKKQEERAIAAILENAKSVEETLNVTRELSRVRGEIERLQGRVRYMESQTQFASITLHLSEDPSILASDTWHPALVAKDAMHTLTARLQRIVNHAIAFTIQSLPLMIGITLAGIILWRIGRRIWHRLQKRLS